MTDEYDNIKERIAEKWADWRTAKTQLEEAEKEIAFWENKLQQKLDEIPERLQDRDGQYPNM